MHLSYLGVYQDEAKELEFYKDVFLCWNQTLKNWQNGGVCFSFNVSNYGIYTPLYFWMGGGCSGIIFKI